MEFALALVETLVDRTTADRLRGHMVVAPAGEGGAAP
jgi:hypothetical protein